MPAPILKIDPKLKDFAANDRQRQFVDAINAHHGYRKAAKALGVHDSVVSDSIKRLKARAATLGYSPEHDMTHAVPEPFVVRGTSTLYNEHGKPRLQWVKTRLDDEKREALIREAVKALCAEAPKAKPVPRPEHVAADLCNVYTLTDCHVGQRSWGKETGEDWDLEIAERTLTGAFEHMVMSSPKAHTAVVAQLGDFLHQDSMRPETPTSGHLLDADSRFAKVVSVAVKILRRVIGLALERHEKVVVLMAEGNHDLSSSIWLRVMFAQLFENEPRVEVIDSELPYYVYQHGKTMLGWHHGHLKRLEGLPIMFAAQFPEVWGETRYRYIHTGHLHHVHEKEHEGVTVVQHPTLAARDAHSARHGYVSHRQVTAITYHAQWGQVARTTIVPEMLRAA